MKPQILEQKEIMPKRSDRQKLLASIDQVVYRLAISSRVNESKYTEKKQRIEQLLKLKYGVLQVPEPKTNAGISIGTVILYTQRVVQALLQLTDSFEGTVLSTQEMLFNSHISSMRVAIENCIGMLKMRWS